MSSLHQLPTGRQLAAARALLGMSQADLARRSAISVPTLKRMEASAGKATGMANNVLAVRRALEDAGIEFTNHGLPGVKLNRAPELWRKVAFPRGAAAASLRRLLTPLVRAYAAAGLPGDVEVWRRAAGPDLDVYLFSPAAAQLIAEQLEEAGATAVSFTKLKPGFTRIQL
jgi:transcriptional regulator with XRE-family HTH domain